MSCFISTTKNKMINLKRIVEAVEIASSNDVNTFLLNHKNQFNSCVRALNWCKCKKRIFVISNISKWVHNILADIIYISCQIYLALEQRFAHFNKEIADVRFFPSKLKQLRSIREKTCRQYSYFNPSTMNWLCHFFFID